MLQRTTKTRVVGVEIAVDHTRYAVVDVRGNIIARDGFKASDCHNIGEFVSRLSEGIVKLIEENGGYDIIRSVGISSPSGNFQTGSIVNAPNMPWKGVIPLAAMMRDRLGLAVTLANDCHVQAMGELEFGCAHGMKNFVMMTMYDGVGCAIMANGRIHLGSHGHGGEVGHTCVVPGGRTCGCGKNGCLESYCSSWGFVRTAKNLLKNSEEPSLMRDIENLTPQLIADCCDKGDALAIEAARKTGQLLGTALANLASIVDPEAIILAGEMTTVGKWLMEPADAAFEKHVFNNIAGRVKLKVSDLSEEDRVLLGASVLAWEVKEYSLFI